MAVYEEKLKIENMIIHPEYFKNHQVTGTRDIALAIVEHTNIIDH